MDGELQIVTSARMRSPACPLLRTRHRPNDRGCGGMQEDGLDGLVEDEPEVVAREGRTGAAERPPGRSYRARVLAPRYPSNSTSMEGELVDGGESTDAIDPQ